MSDILLVHGSCHGAWCWRDLIPLMQARGHDVRALDLPGHGDDNTPLSDVTLQAYAEAISNASGPQTTLVGHSMGGYAITAAAEATPELFARLIYLCAYVPQDDLTLSEMRKHAPRQLLLPAVRMSDDGVSFTVDLEMAPDIFYHDCPSEAVSFALRLLGPEALAPTRTRVPLSRRSQDIPRRYIRCLDDRTIPPEFQITITEDWPAEHVQKMSCGHSPFFADPAGLAERLERAMQG